MGARVRAQAGYHTPGRRDALIRRLWSILPRGDLALRLGLDPSTVTYHAQRLGLPAKPTGRAPRAECGTAAEYRRGCRCGMCRRAHAAYHRRRYQETRPRDPAPHGTRSRYQRGCKCRPCVGAQSAYSRLFRQRKRGELPAPDAGGPPARWRCPCDGYRINTGATCAACGGSPPWITVDARDAV